MMSLQETANYFAIFVGTELTRYVVFSLAWLAVIALGLRWAAQRKIQRQPTTRKDFFRDFKAASISVVAYGLVGVVTVQLMTLGVLKWRTDWPGWTTFGLTVLATIVAHDAYFYWTHRLMHHRKLFRIVHATHHRARAPSVWTSYAFSTSEATVQALFIPVWYFFVPLNDLGVFVFFVHQLGRNVTGHAGYEFAWSGFTRSALTGWMTTSTHHDLHHSEGGCNYGLYFTWWDRLMGTEHPQYHERFEAVARSPIPLAPAAAGADHVVIGNT